jgi:hypothetical protein
MGTNLEAQGSQQPVEKRVQTLSDQLNQAAQDNNHGAYDNAMREITDIRSKVAPASQPQFDKAVTDSLMFETVGLYDLKRNYGTIDTNSDQRIKPDELDAYAAKGNFLQKAFVDNHVKPNYKAIANASEDNVWSWTGWSDDHIRLKDLNKGVSDSKAMRHFYEKSNGGQSLYERFSDKEGNLNGIDEAIKNRQKLGLSDADVASLQHIQDSRSNWSFIPFKNDMKAADLKQLAAPVGAREAQDTMPVANEAMKHFYKKNENGISLYSRFSDENGNLNGIDEALKNHKQYGLSEQDIASLKYLNDNRSNWSYLPFKNDMSDAVRKKLPLGNGLTLDETSRAAEIEKNNAAAKLPPLQLMDSSQPQLKMEVGSPRPAVAAEAKPEAKPIETQPEKPVAKEVLPSAKLMEMASVRKGEGFWQSAERILKSDGKPHSHEEKRELTNALRAMYEEEKVGRAADMRVRHQLVSKLNFQKLINKVQSDSVKQALMKLAAE